MAKIPAEITNQKYLSLTTFRKSGTPVSTPIWFAEMSNRLYVMTRSDSGKCKRIRNNDQISVAPCTIRGRVTGPQFQGVARLVAGAQGAAAHQAIRRKYWLARLPLLWRRIDAYIELEIAQPQPSV